MVILFQELSIEQRLQRLADERAKAAQQQQQQQQQAPPTAPARTNSSNRSSYGQTQQVREC